MSEVQPKSLLLEIEGQTDFHMGNPNAPLAVDIAFGYRKITKKSETTSTLYASLASVKEEGISIKDIINSCTTDTVDNIPEILEKVAFKSFSVTYGTGGVNATSLTITFNCKLTINNRIFDAAIIVDYTKAKNGKKATFLFKGILKVNTHRFELQFSKNEIGWYVYAGYINKGKVTIKLRELATYFFGAEVTKQIPELAFTLKDFKAFLLLKKEQNKTSLLFGMGADLALDLKKLPLAGPTLSQKNAFAFKEVLAIYAKGTFTKEELKSFAALPKVDVAEGFNISTQLIINGKENYYVLNDGNNKNYEADTSESENSTKEVVKPLGGAISSKAKWKKINKKIGPVNLQRIGFAYENSKVILLLDASMEMAGMGMELMGFGLGFKLKWPPETPDFYLDGLGLSYKVPPIEISGAFLHATTTYKGKTIDVYNGGAIIKVSKFSIAAIGSYGKVENRASLFIYGVFNGPIGGPAFFFVTGLAAGFGYNRKVNIPSVNEVASYPLVSLAMQPEKDGGLLSVLGSLETPMKNGKTPIEISVGDYWFAVGIKFSSFKIIESFVLLTVNFGTQLEFAIMGLSRLSWPEKSISTEPIVYIELAILAHFGPGSDVISVEAVLTPNSYVLSKNCKLSGGFAFYTWIKGPHEGDFVITLGGYHPKFNKPTHYPTVPRVALNWRISKQLIIKGELYYALTTSAIMAGGKWEVLFKTSIVKVTFVLWANMLIAWAPFQYAIDMGITIRIEARIKIAFVRVHFNFEMSVQLHLWGPPFAGEIYVDWTIFSFTIPFGNHKKTKPQNLKWHKFATGFIPQKKEGSNAPVARVAATNVNGHQSVSNIDPINITISNGLIEVKGKEKFSVVNPYQLGISIESFIPVSSLKINGKQLPKETVMKSAIGNSNYSKRELQIGIRPCGFTAKDVTFNMNVKVMLGGKTLKIDDLSYICSAKGVAEALWGATASKNNNNNPGTSKVITNVLSGVELLSKKKTKEPQQIRTFDFSKLEEDTHEESEWKFESVKVGAAYHEYDVLGYYSDKEGVSTRVKGIIEKTFNKAQVSEKRNKICELLKDVFDADIEDIEEDKIEEKIIKRGTEYFKGTPVLCEIGEIPQYPTDVNN